MHIFGSCISKPFFLSLAARKQIRACFVVCLHKDQLSSSVSARREKHVFVSIVNLKTTEITLRQQSSSAVTKKKN